MVRVLEGSAPVNSTPNRASQKGDGNKQELSSLLYDSVRCGSRAGASSASFSKSTPRTSRTLTLKVCAKEYMWLWETRRGVGTMVIARREGVSIRRVWFGLARARANEKIEFSRNTVWPPNLIPLFPVGPYTPLSACGHRQKIPTGSLLCCMVCH